MHDSGFDRQRRGLLLCWGISSKWTEVADDEIRTGDGEMSDPIKMENCLGESTFLKYPGMPPPTDKG